MKPEPSPAPCRCDRAEEETSSLRRRLIAGALAAGAMPAGVLAADPAAERPRKGDRLVYAEGQRKGTPVLADELRVGDTPVPAVPKDPDSGVVRDRNRLNIVLLVRLDAAAISQRTRPHAAEGVVAYSAICTHYGCQVTLGHENGHAVVCNCHGSTFDVGDLGEVIAGPAPRRLAILPIAVADGNLVVAAGFSGRLGPPQQ